MPIGKPIKRMLIVAASTAIVVLSVFGIQFVYGGSWWNHSRFTGLQAATRQSERQSTYGVSGYDRLLQTYVTEQGWVDYAGVGRERAALNRFLEQLARVSPNEFKDSSSMACSIDSALGSLRRELNQRPCARPRK